MRKEGPQSSEKKAKEPGSCATLRRSHGGDSKAGREGARQARDRRTQHQNKKISDSIRRHVISLVRGGRGRIQVVKKFGRRRSLVLSSQNVVGLKLGDQW